MDKQRKAYRHGDIVFERLPDDGTIRANGRRKTHLTIAKGEATGHAHVLDGEVLVFESVDDLLLAARDTEREMVVTKESTLTHPEHGPITLPVGRYTVRRQREFWGEQRYVAD